CCDNTILILFGKDWDREQEFVLAERRAVATDRTLLANRCARCRTAGRSPHYQRHYTRAEKRLPLVRLSRSLRTCDNDLQSLRSVGAARHMGKPVPGARRQWSIEGHADDRLHSRQSASLG